MPQFRYRAYDQHGALKKGDIEARSREAALEALHKQSFYTLDLLEAKPVSSQRWWDREVFGGGSLPLSGLALFTRELSILINADLPLDEALRIVSLQPLILNASPQVHSGNTRSRARRLFAVRRHGGARGRFSGILLEAR